MYPSRFRYEAPRSLDEAISLLHDGGDYAKVLAGGQSLVPLMKLRFASPQLVVDINNVPALSYHRAEPDGTLRIGALCRHADLERSGLLKTTQPTMAAAAPLIADPIVRNRGTLAGQPLTAETIEQAAELAAQAARPRTDHRGSAEYKRHMVRTFVLRLLSRGQAAETAERAA